VAGGWSEASTIGLGVGRCPIAGDLADAFFENTCCPRRLIDRRVQVACTAQMNSGGFDRREIARQRMRLAKICTSLGERRPADTCCESGFADAGFCVNVGVDKFSILIGAIVGALTGVGLVALIAYLVYQCNTAAAWPVGTTWSAWPTPSRATTARRWLSGACAWQLLVRQTSLRTQA